MSEDLVTFLYILMEQRPVTVNDVDSAPCVIKFNVAAFNFLSEESA